MGQPEVLEYLDKIRSCGDASYQTIAQIQKGINELDDRLVRYAVKQLYIYGYLEREPEKKIFSDGFPWKKKFRLCLKYSGRFINLTSKNDNKYINKRGVVENATTD